MSDVLEILEAHQEEYDEDCGVHGGCSCGWLENVNRPRSEWAQARPGYREHLAEQVETYIELRVTEVLRELH